MGAVTGGVGGAFLGNKAGHGIIGALAGAFMGSKAEDKYKERRHEGQGQQYQEDPNEACRGVHACIPQL